MDEELKVIISAETAELKKGCKEATDEIKKVGKASKEMNSALSKLQKTIGDQKKELSKLTDEYKNAVLEKGKDSDAAKQLAQKIKSLNSELAANEDRLAAAEKEADDLSKSFKKAGIASSQLKDGFQKAGQVVKKGAAVAAKAIAGITTALLATGPATKEYREGQAKLQTAFESAGGSAKEATQTYNDLYRVLGDEDTSVEAANHLAKLTTNQKDLSEWTNICQGIYATFGDSLPIEGLTEAANETAKTGTLTGGLADALNWAGVSEEDFNAKLAACNTEAERESLIRGTLNGLYNEAASNYERNAAAILAQNEANANMQASIAALGEAMSPLNTMLTQFGSDILTTITPYIEDFVNEHGPELEDLLDDIADGIDKALKFIDEHWEQITTIAGIIAAVATAIAIVNAAMTVYNVVMGIASTVSLPMILIIGAITAAIILCATHWDEIKTTISNFVNSAKEKLDNFKTNVSNIFNAVKDKIKEKIDGAKDAVHNAIEKIKSFFHFEWHLPKLKLPHFSIKGKFSLSPPQIPKFSVSWYQRGGVFDKPTMFGYGNGSIGGLGENGAEAVVPLEKNTQWLDRIADKLAGKQNNIPIVLQVDGNTFAKTTVRSINDLTRQTGSLQLQMV